MVNQGSLKKILGLCGIVYSGSLARYHTCPICCPLEIREMEWDRPLRIFPSSIDADFLFRCYQCGTTFDSLELISRFLKLPYDKASELMLEKGIISCIHTPGKLDRYGWADLLVKHFEKARSRYEFRVAHHGVFRRFGEWGAFNFKSSPFVLPDGVTPTRREYADYLVRVLRDIFGRPVRAETWSERGMMLGSFSYWKEPMAFTMPAWARFHDLKELILCDTEQTAEEVERVVAAWPKEKRIPIALPVYLDCFPIASSLPYPKVWLMTRADGLGELGLALYRRGLTEVKIHRIPGNHNDLIPSLKGMTREELCSPQLPDCMESVVSRIVQGTQETLTGRLSTVMNRSYISGEAKREVIQRCAIAVGTTEEALLNQLEADANPYGLLDKGRLFVGRNGRYFMRDRKDRWSEISNFCIRRINKKVNARGDAIHDLRLSVDGLTTTFPVTAALLDSPPRLWKEARRAAALAGLPELIMTNSQHRNLLPSLIKSTAQVACGC